MIQLNKRIFIVLIVITSSCSSVDSFRQAYKNFLPSSDESYIVQPGDSIWSIAIKFNVDADHLICLLYTSPSPRDRTRSRMPSSA